MSIDRRFLKHSSLALAGRVLPRALYLVQAIAIARSLGPELNGRYVFAFSVMMLAATIGKFGLDALTTREVARNPECTARYVGQNLYLHGALGILGLAVMSLTAVLADKPPEVDTLILLLGVTMVLNSLSLSYTAVFPAMGRFDLQAAAESLLYALMLVGTLTAIASGHGIEGIGVGMASASVVHLASCWWLGRRVIGPADFRVDPGLTQAILSMAWPLALTSVAVGIYYRIDSVFLSVLRTDREVGLYDSAYTFIHALRQLPAAISMAVFPQLSRLFLEDRAKLSEVVGSAVRLGLAVGVPVVVLAFVGAPLLLTMIFAPAYLEATTPLRILLGSIPLMLADAAQSYLLIAAGRQRRLLLVTVTGAVANLLLNAALIPPFGMNGAAMATVVSEAIVLVAMQHYVRDVYGWTALGRSVRTPVVAGTALFACALGGMAMGWLPVVAGFAIYGGAMLYEFGPKAAQQLADAPPAISAGGSSRG